uniref:Uncharacterized protein n=1 Tax=Ursus americanus TaxID=9643 RepID=A0A452RDS0_URSAM
VLKEIGCFPHADGSYRFSGRRARLSGSLSSPGCTPDLQMSACGVQQRMNPLSPCHQ